jgi:hypothetical protein
LRAGGAEDGELEAAHGAAAPSGEAAADTSWVSTVTT